MDVALVGKRARSRCAYAGLGLVVLGVVALVVVHPAAELVALSSPSARLQAEPMDRTLAALAAARPKWTYGPVNRTLFTSPPLGSRSGAAKLAKADAPWKRGSFVPAELPRSFDSRSRWPWCPTLWHIRDQSQCGDCWAFGSVTAFNDRVCIASEGKDTTLLSPSDLVACCTPERGCNNSDGCHGGEASDAFRYFRDYGIVSGGDYRDNGHKDTCWPYTLPEFHRHSGKHNYSAPACRDTCTNPFEGNFASDKRFGKSAYRLESAEEVKRDLMAHGPVACSFDVYEDFMTYRGGVYQHTVGKKKDGHVVRIMGWGFEGETEYWIAANSWNIWWGEHGYFRIKVGDSGIVDPASCVAGEAA